MSYSIPSSFAPYPALRLLVSVCLGILAGVVFAVPLFVWVLFFLLCTIFLFVFLLSGFSKGHFIQGVSLSEALIYTFVVFCGFAAYAGYAYRYVPSDTVTAFVQKDVLLYGKIISRPRISGKGVQWILAVREAFSDGKAEHASGKVKVFLRLENSLQQVPEAGDMVRLKGRLKRIPGPVNPGDFDAREHYRRQGVRSELYCQGPWKMQNYGIEKGDIYERFLVRPARRYLSGSLDSLVPQGDARQFLKGMFLGQRELLDKTVYRQFQAAGTAHVLAVSGLHVGLIVFGILVVLQRMRTRTAGRWAVFLFIVFVLTVYCSVTGNAPSVRRASIMAVVLIGGAALGRQSYPLNSLAAADLVILSIDPLELFSAGFLMTNAAVASIILIYPLLNECSSGWSGLAGAVFRPFWSAFSVSLAAIIGVWPVIAWFFCTFSVAGVLANLPVVFLVSCMLYAMLPALVLNLVLPAFAIYPAACAWFLAQKALDITGFFASQQWAVIGLQPDGIALAVYYVSVLAMMFFFRRQQKAMAIITLLCALNYAVWNPVLRAGTDPPPMAAVSAGRGYAFLLTSAGSTMLVDAGSRPYHRQILDRQLRRYGIEHLDAVLQYRSPDSLVAAMTADRYMFSDDRFLSGKSFVAVRSGGDILSVWTADGFSMLLVSGLDRLLRIDNHPVDRVAVMVDGFGIEDYEKLNTWLIAANPKECMILCSSGMTGEELGLLSHFARKRSDVTVVE